MNRAILDSKIYVGSEISASIVIVPEQASSLPTIKVRLLPTQKPFLRLSRKRGCSVSAAQKETKMGNNVNF